MLCDGKERKEKGTVDADTIESIKVALMGPAAGIGDAFFFNCVRVIAAGIGIGLAAQGNLLGSIIFAVIYGVLSCCCVGISCILVFMPVQILSILYLKPD